MKGYDVIVLAGQSNAEGYGVGEVSEEYVPSDSVLMIGDKASPRFEKAADGKATKIIVPSEIQSLAGLAASVKELVVESK